MARGCQSCIFPFAFAMQSVACSQSLQNRCIAKLTTCSMQTPAPLPRSLVFRPVTSTATSQLKNRKRAKGRSSSRVCAVTQVAAVFTYGFTDTNLQIWPRPASSNSLKYQLWIRKKRSCPLGHAKRKSGSWQHLRKTCRSVCTCWVQQLLLLRR